MDANNPLRLEEPQDRDLLLALLRQSRANLDLLKRQVDTQLAVLAVVEEAVRRLDTMAGARIAH